MIRSLDNNMKRVAQVSEWLIRALEAPACPRLGARLLSCRSVLFTPSQQQVLDSVPTFCSVLFCSVLFLEALEETSRTHCPLLRLSWHLTVYNAGESPTNMLKEQIPDTPS